MAEKINGTALAAEHEKVLKDRLVTLRSSASRDPSVVSFYHAGHRPSVIYTNLKREKASDIGIKFQPVGYETDTPHSRLVDQVVEFNEDQSIDGIMLQLPLPENLQVVQEELLELIDPRKDVDGLTGRGPFLSATTRGVMSILDHIQCDFNQTFAVIGSEGQVGKDIVRVLQEKNAQVIEIDSKNPSSGLTDALNGDIVISCVGKSSLVLPEHIKEGSVLIDVGLGDPDPGALAGDFDPSCYTKARLYTERKGGVGPMTVISLMENVVEAYSKANQ